MKFKQSGFTIIELMITVAIVGILSSIALPSYIQYVNRGRLFEGITQLSFFGVEMEQYLQDNGVYNKDTACGISTQDTANFKYECVIEPAGTNTIFGSKYTITMTGLNTLANHVFTLNQNNQHKSTINNIPKSCWVIGGSCV